MGGRGLPAAGAVRGVFGVPDGISFNSYLLTDEMTVLFDTVDSAVRRHVQGKPGPCFGGP